MLCCTGFSHTVTISDDGTVFAFGHNNYGQLGLGHNDEISEPSRIPNLPKIKQVSCGCESTFCVDYDGYIWSFGYNGEGNPLGTGDSKHCFHPQKMLDLPPVNIISSGYTHVLILTMDDDLWSVGNNRFGQLCLGNTISEPKPKQTSFSNILKISTGRHHSLFQNFEGEIFGCGDNDYGQLGLGHTNPDVVRPSLIRNQPPNIVQISCGDYHSFLLDMQGNVFAAGENRFGQLGLGKTTEVFTQILNIPPIQVISGIGKSSYLLDLEGNIWSFGNNSEGQLGFDSNKNHLAPKKITSISNIEQISSGCCSDHVLAKNSQNEIFVMGNNRHGQLVIKDLNTVPMPTLLHSDYFTIWSNVTKSRAKSARK